jgi:hypothetical protein
MFVSGWISKVAFFFLVASSFNVAGAAATDAGTPPSGGVTQAEPVEAADPCYLAQVTPHTTRPNWDTPAATTQCGAVEVDSGWMDQPMGGGVNQTQTLSSLRYGLTPKLDLRLGLTTHMTQTGGGMQSLEGIGDQWVTARYRFVEQSAKLPAMAFLFGTKIPTANPAKGFGSGYVDHVFTFIASRDVGKNHLDFNVVGTIVGGPNGHDGAAQFGLALTRTVTEKLSWILESYGGPQTGTPDRFGAGFTGVSYAVRPTVVVDAAYSRTYTAGTPHEQYMFGCTYAIRSAFTPMAKGSAIARVLGR